MIRPRTGDFLYTAAERATMIADITHFHALGAGVGVTGVVFGALTPDGNVDLDTTRALAACACARGLEGECECECECECGDGTWRCVLSSVF